MLTSLTTRQEFTAAAVVAGFRRAVETDQRAILALMRQAAEQHATALQRSYPLGTPPRPSRTYRAGTLRDRVELQQRNEFSWKVRAFAPHVHLYERGTGRRRTTGGADRGVSPARGPVFIPLAVRYRTQAFDAVQRLFDRQVEV